MKLREMQYGDHLDQSVPKRRWKFVAGGKGGVWVVRSGRGKPWIPELLEEVDWAGGGRRFRSAADVTRSLERRVCFWGWLAAASLLAGLICLVMGKNAMAAPFVLPVIFGWGGACDSLGDLDQERSQTSKKLLLEQVGRFERAFKLNGEPGVERAHDDEQKKWYERRSWTEKKEWTAAGRSYGAFVLDVLRLMLGRRLLRSGRGA